MNFQSPTHSVTFKAFFRAFSRLLESIGLTTWHFSPKHFLQATSNRRTIFELNMNQFVLQFCGQMNKAAQIVTRELPGFLVQKTCRIQPKAGNYKILKKKVETQVISIFVNRFMYYLISVHKICHFMGITEIMGILYLMKTNVEHLRTCMLNTTPC